MADKTYFTVAKAQKVKCDGCDTTDTLVIEWRKEHEGTAKPAPVSRLVVCRFHYAALTSTLQRFLNFEAAKLLWAQR